MENHIPKIGTRCIRASFDPRGIYVYQAFCPKIAERAVNHGTFGGGFGLNRMTWIKPSLGWMMYRSGYASKVNQERVLRIKITTEGFQELLSHAALASFDPSIHSSEEVWADQLKNSDARVQWDPDRDLALNKIEGRRAIQIGIGPNLVKAYVNEWITEMSDVTAIVHHLGKLATDAQFSGELVHPFPEHIFPVSEDIASRLGMSLNTEGE